MLQPGDIAPPFALPNQDGVLRAIEEHRGRTVVLYFYPKDMTPGCTQEACDVRDAYAAGRVPEGVVVYGVSADSPARHQKFIAKEGLPFELLSDEDHAVCEAYGVWKEKSMMGKRFWGIERSTFVVAPDGTLAAVHRNVKVPGHIDAVLAAIA